MNNYDPNAPCGGACGDPDCDLTVSGQSLPDWKARAERAEAELAKHRKSAQALFGRIGQQERDQLRAELARLQGQTRWQCKCGGTDCEGQRENERLKAELEREEKAVLDVIAERDEAERILDDITSDILGEPIDWEFHDAKWAEAAELASDLRAQLAAENQRRMDAEMQAARDAKRADANAAQLAAAHEDSKRLDWLEQFNWDKQPYGDEVLYTLMESEMWCGEQYENLRAAIDAAMKGIDPKETTK